MEAKKLTLATKQEMLDKAFELALDRLVSLPDDEYVALLAELADIEQSLSEQEKIRRAEQSAERGV